MKHKSRLIRNRETRFHGGSVISGRNCPSCSAGFIAGTETGGVMDEDKQSEDKQSRDAGSFWEGTVMRSIRARTLRDGKRFDAVFKFYKVMMTGDGSEENDRNEDVLAEMETALIDAPPLRHEGLAYVDKHGDLARIYLNPMLEFES